MQTAGLAFRDAFWDGERLGTSVRMSMEDPEESEHSTGSRGGAVASWEASFRYSQVERGNQLPAR